MRVISGTAKGRRLKSVPGDSTRPIMDRVKENLFNILGNAVVDACWLDLFAGTGQVGIEALSRGASYVVFIDNARLAIRTVKANLAHTNLSDNAFVIQTDAFSYLSSFDASPFDLIYVAPPQYIGMWIEVISLLDQKPGKYLKRDGVVVVQIDPREFQDVETKALQLSDRRKYGNTLLCFYKIDA